MAWSGGGYCIKLFSGLVVFYFGEGIVRMGSFNVFLRFLEELNFKVGFYLGLSSVRDGAVGLCFNFIGFRFLFRCGVRITSSR